MQLPIIPDLFPIENKSTKELGREYVEALKQARSLRKRLEIANQCVERAKNALDNAALKEFNQQKKSA